MTDVALKAALGCLDLPFTEDSWRNDRPKLTAWFAAAAQRPSYRATLPRHPAASLIRAGT